MSKVRNAKMPQMPSGGSAAAKAAGALVFGGVGLAVLISKSIFSVEAGHRGVMFNRFTGLREGFVLDEGIHFRYVSVLAGTVARVQCD